MVRRADSSTSPSYGNNARSTPSSTEMAARKVFSVGLAVLLYTAAIPFTPVSWVIDAEGGYIIDHFVAGILLLSAVYFQWQIGSLTSPLSISIQTSPGGGSSVRNGRLDKSGGSIDWVWRPSEFWPYAICEALLLSLAQFGGSELVRRGVVCGVVAALWAVGWFATPRWLKTFAWEHIKAMWFWIALSEVRNVGSRGYRRGARRAW